MECYWCLTEHEGICPAAPYYVENKVDAMERAGQLMSVPMKDLPPLAYKYALELCRVLGMSGEVMLTAFAFYAQIVEGLECKDLAYQVNEDNRRFFTERVK